MTAPQTSLPSPPSNEDLEQLRLLSIFHYVVAGLAGLFSLFPFIYLALGIAMVTGHLDSSKGEAPPAFIGWIFVAIALLLIVGGIVFSTLLALAGRRLAARTHYTYCLVMACISTLFMPFGTALGVFTIVVLSRERVKAMFVAGAPAR